MDGSWNPWKMTAIAMALVVVTALVTTVVVANWKGRATEPPAVGAASPSTQASSALAPAPPEPPTPPPPPATQAQPKPALSLQAAVDACNRYAANRTAHGDKTVEVVKDGAIGGAIGAAVGAASGAIAGGGGGAGKGAGIGGLVGVGGGVLYGLNENKKHDEHYRQAYAGCMRSHGYAG
jgi:hypothetical protein